MGMSDRDLRLAAERGQKIDSATQNKLMEEAIEKTKARVAEINAMKAEEEARKLAQQELENQPLMSKRQRIEAERAKALATIDNPDKAASTTQVTAEAKVVEEVQQTFKPRTNNALFKPFAQTLHKEKVTEVPSYGISYPDGWEIYITPYSGDDLDDLNNSSLSLKYILTKCLEGVYTNFDKNILTFYDVLYLSYYRRILSINDNQIEIAARCPHCNHYSRRVVDISKEIEFEESRIPSLPINAEFSFGKLSFTYLTYKDFMSLKTELKSEELAYQCTTECDIDTEAGQVREEELQKLFGSLVGEDVRILEYIREVTYHGIKPLVTLCNNKDCGETFEAILDEMSSIVLPFRRSQEDIRSKISFG